MKHLVPRLPLIAALLFCGVMVLAPLAVMAFETVHTPDGLSFEAYRTILADPLDRRQMLASLGLGVVATAIAGLLGAGHAWLTSTADLPAASWLRPLGIAPLVIPPILVAMGFADLADVAGFWPCALLLGVSNAPFVAVMTARGLHGVDGRGYEAALLARGRGRAERLLARMIAPEVLAGCLFAFIFTVSEHGVPEFLTVKGKTWHTYAEGIFARWTRRATGVTHADQVSGIVAAVPLVALILVALVVALRLRARANLRGEFVSLPPRRLGAWRWPALLLPATYLGAGVGVPLLVMARWALGSTDATRPMSLGVARDSFRLATTEAGDDLVYTLLVAVVAVVVLLVVAPPLARRAARGRSWIDGLCVIPLAVPAILLGIGMVQLFNHPWTARLYAGTFDFYDSFGMVAFGYAARFLPFAVLTLSSAVRRIPASIEEAARLTPRRPWQRALWIHGPLLLPAAWSASWLVYVLALRELDLAVVLPAGNGTVVRRLSNVVHFGGEDMGGALALLLLATALIVPLATVVLTGRRLRSLS